MINVSQSKFLWMNRRIAAIVHSPQSLVILQMLRLHEEASVIFDQIANDDRGAPANTGLTVHIKPSSLRNLLMYKINSPVYIFVAHWSEIGIGQIPKMNPCSFPVFSFGRDAKRVRIRLEGLNNHGHLPYVPVLLRAICGSLTDTLPTSIDH